MTHLPCTTLKALACCGVIAATAQATAPANAQASAPAPAQAPDSAASAPAASTDAADAVKGTQPILFRIRPVLIDTGSAQGTSLGLDYDVQARYAFRMGDQAGAGEEVFSVDDTNATLRSGQIDLRARGTLASTRQKNPNPLLDFSAKAVYKINAVAYFARLGGVVGYETDQGFAHRQSMFGLVGSVSKVGSLRPGDAGSIIVNYGSVNPTRNEERKRLLGSLGNYRRWNAEFSYSIPVNRAKLRSIDLNYRLYREASPVDAIKAAGLDRNRLALVRANLDQDFFLQYSRGSLPFDLNSERALMIGWTMKLE